MLGIAVVLLSMLWQCFCFADELERLKPDIVYEAEQAAGKGETITSKIRRNTGKEEVIVQVDKITKSPHSIIASGLEVSSQDKVNIKSAIDSLKSKRVDKKMRFKGEILSDPQKKIDTAARAFIKNNKDMLLANEANLKLSICRRSEIRRM